VLKRYPDAKLLFCIDGECTKKEINEDYKAQREKKDEIRVDVNDIVGVLSNLPNVYFSRSDKHEADDLIANVAYSYKDKVDNIIIYSGDKDFWQLANDFQVSNEYDKGFNTVDDNLVFSKFEVSIKELLAFRILDGDKSDNLKPPVPRVRKEFKKEIADKWYSDLTVNNFIEIMYGYKDTKNWVNAEKYLEAVNKVEENLYMMDLTKYKEEEDRFKFNFFKCNNPDKFLLQKYELRAFEVFVYDYFKKEKNIIA
jgi:5'-3' exonuclease